MDSGICGHTWNGGQCCFSFEDDENFLVEVLMKAKEAIADAGIANATSAPTFLFGFSAGSVMTHRMTCTHSDLFQAAVTVSGTLNFPGKNLAIQGVSNKLKLVLFKIASRKILCR